MPTLAQVLPRTFFDRDSAAEKASRYLELEVVATKLGGGSPCSGHEGIFETWPGPEENVRQWFLLSNGKAVGINEDPNEGLSFPIAEYER